MARQQRNTCWWTISAASCGTVLSTGIPRQVIARSSCVKAVVAGSIPSRAECNKDSCFLPVGTAVVLCESQIGGLCAGEERAIKTNSNPTLREALPMDIMPVWHVPFAAPPSRTTVKQRLAFGGGW